MILLLIIIMIIMIIMIIITIIIIIIIILIPYRLRSYEWAPEEMSREAGLPGRQHEGILTVSIKVRGRAIMLSTPVAHRLTW
jgi:heme/copper-type cytochrome/quinol oxidase subunit 2